MLPGYVRTEVDARHFVLSGSGNSSKSLPDVVSTWNFNGLLQHQNWSSVVQQNNVGAVIQEYAGNLRAVSRFGDGCLNSIR
jgi:hypothetical protein